MGSCRFIPRSDVLRASQFAKDGNLFVQSVTARNEAAIRKKEMLYFPKRSIVRSVLPVAAERPLYEIFHESIDRVRNADYLNKVPTASALLKEIHIFSTKRLLISSLL